MSEALVVGNNRYENLSDLKGAEVHAIKVDALLRTHQDGRPNMICKLLTSKKADIRDHLVNSGLKELFSHNCSDLLIFYFYGHGAKTSKGLYLQAFNSDGGVNGILMSDLIEYAMDSKVSDIVIILDCCHSGGIADLQFDGDRGMAGIPEGVSILASTGANQKSYEPNGESKFSDAICRQLEDGGDEFGRVKISHLLTEVMDSLEQAWNQKPQGILNIRNNSVLRINKPQIPHDVLFELTAYFPSKDFEFSLSRKQWLGGIIGKKGGATEFIDVYYNKGLIEVAKGRDMGFGKLLKPKTYKLTELGQRRWDYVKREKN